VPNIERLPSSFVLLVEKKQNTNQQQTLLRFYSSLTPPSPPLSTFKSLFLSLSHTHTLSGIGNMNEKGTGDNHTRYKTNIRCKLQKAMEITEL